MATKVLRTCRGVGLGYAVLKGVEPGAAARAVRAESGEELPCCVVAAPEGVRGDAVAIVPLVDEALTLEVGGLAWKWKEGSTKLGSRLLTLTHKREAEALRELKASSIEVLDAWRDGQDAVWHLRCSAEEADGFFVWGYPEAKAIVLETQGERRVVSVRLPDTERTPVFCAAWADGEATRRSATVPAEDKRAKGKHFRVEADGSESGAEGDAQGLEVAPALRAFACVPSFKTDALLAEARKRSLGAAGDPAYAEWFAARAASREELARQRSAAAKGGLPTIEAWIVGSVDIERTQASLDAQTLAPAASGEGSYVLFLTSGDELEPDALFELASAIAAGAGAEAGAEAAAGAGAAPDLVFADEDVRLGKSLEQPALKTPLNRGRLLSYDCVGAPLVLSRELLERAGGFVEGAAWHYDLVLRASELCSRPVHVPRVLCHRPAIAPSEEAHEAGRRALLAHLGRIGIAATVKAGPERCTYRVHYQIPRPWPEVSIVIPSREHADLLRTCVESILERTTYPRYTVTIVENGSSEAETFALYDELCERDDRVRVVMWTDALAASKGVAPGSFNYPALINYGVSRTSGELVVLLNNDTEVIAGDWLQEMAGQLQRSEVGIVGAKLLLADGLIQHAGMVANPNGDFAHVNRCISGAVAGYLHTADLPGDFSMVTGACQMVRRELWDELGGYDQGLAVGYNDGDFCLRAGEAGYAVAFTPYALLHHREFASRGREAGDPEKEARLAAEKARFLDAHPAFAESGDPALNPQLDGFSDWYQLRW